MFFFFFFQAEDGIRDGRVTGVQTCALPIFRSRPVAARLQDLPRRLPDLPRPQPAVVPQPRRGRRRSEERRVGKEWRSRWGPYHLKKKKRRKEREEGEKKG